MVAMSQAFSSSDAADASYLSGLDPVRAPEVHLIFFIRDAALEQTSLMSLIFWTNIYSLNSNFCLLPAKLRRVAL